MAHYTADNNTDSFVRSIALFEEGLASIKSQKESLLAEVALVVRTVELYLPTTLKLAPPLKHNHFPPVRSFSRICNTLCSRKYVHLRIQNCDQLLWFLRPFLALAIAVKHIMRTSSVFWIKRKKMATPSSAKSVKKRKELSLEEKWTLVDESDRKAQQQLTTNFGIETTR